LSGRLRGKRAVVTGARTGIGRAIASRFAAEGAAVLACSRAERPAGLPGEILWRKCDVSSPADVGSLREHALTELGEVDVLVNNAGVQIEKTVVDSTDEDWELLMGTNARGVFNMCRALIPAMGDRGAIVNVGSIAANIADSGMALYNGSKAFVHGLTRAIAADHGPAIRCNAIAPGWIMTGMADAAFAASSDPEEARRAALARHPCGRFGRPEDIAGLAAWLASDEAEFVSGQCWVADGGLTAGSPINPSLL